ncbi:MAG: hypothetical protein IKU72_02155 [Oscillospiraceae bacterium]|nr:hypothetical protein [Oscillospiraceae bacterium]
MPKNELFGKHIDPACCYCEHSLPEEAQTTLNCRFKGKVEPSGSCRRFSYDPLRRVPTRQVVLPSYSDEEFKL